MTRPRKSGKPADITETALRQVMRGGAAVSIEAVLDGGGGYYMEVQMGEARMRLLNARGDYRTFSSLDTVARLVESLGATSFYTRVASV